MSNEEIAQAYEYLRMIAYMLACKKRYFNKESDYDDFSHYMATFVYNRMTSKKQYLDKNDPDYLEPIKSVLNYMKQTLFVRKCDFCNFEYRFNTTSEDEYETLKGYAINNIKNDNRGLLQSDIEAYLSKINNLIYDEVYNGVYGNDKILSWKLYTSVLLSLLRNFTLSNKNKERLDNFNNNVVENARNTYEEKISQYMEEENATAAIVYDLDEKYKDYIFVVLQKVKKQMVIDISDLTNSYEISDEMIEDILMSGLKEESDKDE